MAKQPRSLHGKVVAITGAARGIGRATAQALVREGARVSIGDLDLDLARQTAQELGGDTAALELNVTERESFGRYLDATESELGPIEVLINNAGIMQIGPFLEEADATAVRQVDINLHGVLMGSKLGLERMLPRRNGHIVNVASMAGKIGLAGEVTYCATKHAVVGATEALRAEFRDAGIDFSVVMPGVVNTELAAGLKAVKGVRNQEPEDVANAIVEALKTNRFDVFVPKSAGRIQRSMVLFPRRWNEAVARWMGTDQVIAGADRRAREHYEERASSSEPQLGTPAREAEAESEAKADGKATEQVAS
jgi:NAD(P)-dependent dehydrogenase (short-subunit alcohol dehydrogenase family)